MNIPFHIPSVLDYFRFSLADVGHRIFLARTFEVEFRPGVFFISYTGTTIFTILPFYQRRTVSLYIGGRETPRLILDLGTTCRVLALSIYLTPPPLSCIYIDSHQLVGEHFITVLRNICNTSWSVN